MFKTSVDNSVAGIVLPTLAPDQITPLPTRHGENYTMLPTLSPNEIAEASNIPEVHSRFLEIHYDASQTVNNRQVPANDSNCSGGSGAITRWSRTHNIADQNFLIQDATGNPVQVIEISFAQVHPGRRYSDRQCPSDEYRVSVTVKSLVPDTLPDLTGYTAEFRTKDGHIIGITDAHDGIAITLKGDQQPEDLYDRPARLLIYDGYTKDAQPTPTPTPELQPEQKQIIFTVNPQEWDSEYRGDQNRGPRYWTETTRQSPDLSSRNLRVADANNRLWTVKSIYSVEKTGKSSGPDEAEFNVYLVNDNRAKAQLTGYRVTISTSEGHAQGGGYWDPIEDELPIGRATIKGKTQEVPTGEIIIMIWDTYYPALNSE